MRNMKLILITGVPGTGKTSIGDYLKDKHGFKHINFEDGISLNQFISDTNAFLNGDCKISDVVTTWGFVPSSEQIQLVDLLKSKGFKLFWFDGNRLAAFREYLKAGRLEKLFYLQMYRICESDVISKINRIIINTFDKDGVFRKKGEIVEEIERHFNI